MHCKDCHNEYKEGDRHLWKCIENDNDCELCPSKEIKALNEVINRHIKEKGSIECVSGVFGDTGKNKAYVEEYVFDKDLGITTKFYGCSIPYKGHLKSDTIDACATVKRTLMATVGVFLKYWYFLSPLVLIFYKTAIRAFVYWFAQIYEADLKQKTFKSIVEFSPLTRELIRVGYKLAERIPVKNTIEREYETENMTNEGEKNSQEFRVRVRRIIWCIATFIQFDSAYYWRVQDPLSNLNKDNLLNNPRKELARLFDLAIERERAIKHKIIQLKRAFMLITLFPPIANIAYDFFMELDLDAIKPDDIDFYWAGRRQQYDFGGKDWNERRPLVEQKDKELNNVIIKA